MVATFCSVIAETFLQKLEELHYPNPGVVLWQNTPERRSRRSFSEIDCDNRTNFLYLSKQERKCSNIEWGICHKPVQTNIVLHTISRHTEEYKLVTLNYVRIKTDHNKWTAERDTFALICLLLAERNRYNQQMTAKSGFNIHNVMSQYEGKWETEIEHR